MPTAHVMPNATLTPGKLELISAWLPDQPWFPGGEVTQLGTYRFVDPAGEVGIESFLLDCGGVTVHLPLTYRADQIEGTLVGTMEHSELGTRYVYDAHTDPVYGAELIRVIATGETEASLSTGKEPTAHCEGSGADLGDVSAVVPGETIRAHAICGSVNATVPYLVADIDTTKSLGHLRASWKTPEGADESAVVAVVGSDEGTD